MKLTISPSILAMCALLISAQSIASISINSCLTAQCRQDFEKFKVYAVRKHPEAVATLAELYHHGYGTKANISRAVQNYKKAARMGVVRSQYKAGLIHLFNQDYYDYDKGIKYLEDAAFNQYSDAMYALGVIYYSGQLTKVNVEKADKWLARAFRAGHDGIPLFVERMVQIEPITSQNYPELYSELLTTPPHESHLSESQSTNPEKIEAISTKSPTLRQTLSAQLKQFWRVERYNGTPKEQLSSAF